MRISNFSPFTFFFSLELVSDFILAVGSNRVPIRWTTELMKSVSLGVSHSFYLSSSSSSSFALFIPVLRGTLGLDSVSVAAFFLLLN